VTVGLLIVCSQRISGCNGGHESGGKRPQAVESGCNMRIGARCVVAEQVTGS
jgi:hypothetical protein